MEDIGLHCHQAVPSSLGVKTIADNLALEIRRVRASPLISKLNECLGRGTPILLQYINSMGVVDVSCGDAHTVLLTK